MAYEHEPEFKGLSREQYEEDKDNRLLVADLSQEQACIYRAKLHIDDVEYISDIPIVIRKITQDRQFIDIDVATVGPRKTGLSLHLSYQCFVFDPEKWPEDVDELTYEEERGYFLGYPEITDDDINGLLKEAPIHTHLGQLALVH